MKLLFTPCVAFLALAGCAGQPVGRPSILLITVDTLRADHLGHYGYGRNTSPFLDRMARERCTTFIDASAVVPKTVPSTATIFTAQYPNRNRVASNHHLLPDSALSLAEILADAGYRTAALTTNGNLIPERGFAQGFAEFENLGPRNRAERLVDMAQTRLARGFGEDFFFWLHFVDPHGPYSPLPPYDEIFLDDPYYDKRRRATLAYEPMPGFNENYVLGAVPRYIQRPWQYHPRRFEADFYTALYDGEIRYLDAQLERLWKHIEELELDRRLVLVFTADHGESMGEHGYYFEHGWFVYRHQVGVPLMICEPGQQRGRTITSPARLLDIAPTLLDYAAVKPPASFQGRSLRPSITGDRGGPAEAIYAQSPTEEYPHQYRSLRLRSWKYIVDREGREELYDLAADPGETRDLAAQRPEMLAAFRRGLENGAWQDSAAKPPIELGTEGLDPRILEDLRALGYVD